MKIWLLTVRHLLDEKKEKYIKKQRHATHARDLIVHSGFRPIVASKAELLRRIYKKIYIHIKRKKKVFFFFTTSPLFFPSVTLSALRVSLSYFIYLLFIYLRPYNPYKRVLFFFFFFFLGCSLTPVEYRPVVTHEHCKRKNSWTKREELRPPPELTNSSFS